MVETQGPPVAASPLSFMAITDGRQFMVPLSSLYFDAKGALKADRWPLYVQHKDLVDSYLQRLLISGAIQTGPPPSAKPALKVTAVTPGATGVLIEIEFSNVSANSSSSPDSTADVKVSETDTYSTLHPDNLIEILGDSAGTGHRPGLAFVSSSGTPSLPKAGRYPFAGSPATVAIPDNSGPGDSFSLQARGSSADGALIVAVVQDVNAVAGTFTLQMSWTKTVTSRAIKDIPTDFAFVVTIEPPDGGYRPPVARKTVLSGGTDALSVAAVRGSATVLSNP